MSDQQQPLTELQFHQFHDEGWTAVGRVLGDDLIEAMRNEEARIRAFEPYAPHTTVFRSQMARYSEVVRQVITSSPLVGVARQLIGPTVCHWFNQFVTKMPDGNQQKSKKD